MTCSAGIQRASDAGGRSDSEYGELDEKPRIIPTGCSNCHRFREYFFRELRLSRIFACMHSDPSDCSPPSTAIDTLIQVDRISRRNPKGDGWLIKDVRLSLASGERLGLVGPSGAGKTVLLRALALLDPLDSGRILWHASAVSGEAVPIYRKQVIYLHQRPALFDGSVEDNLRLPFGLKAHRGRQFDRRRVLDLLAELSRDAEFLSKPSRRLSGGESQLVALFRAVQLEPTILLLDEPTASLDPNTGEAVERMIEKWLAEKRPRALVWVSHDPEQTQRMTTRQIRLRGDASKRSASTMHKPYIELSYFQVALAALLILINGLISVLLKLDLERTALDRRSLHGRSASAGGAVARLGLPHRSPGGRAGDDGEHDADRRFFGNAAHSGAVSGSLGAKHRPRSGPAPGWWRCWRWASLCGCVPGTRRSMPFRCSE